MTDTDTDLSDVVAPAESHENKGSGTEADNIKALRAQRDELRQQNQWMQQQLSQQQQFQNRPKAPIEEVDEVYDFNQLEQEQFPEGKNLAKAFKTLDKRLKSYDQKLTAKDQKIAVLEAAMQHKDFNDIVTADNIKKYIETDEDNLESVRKADNPGLKIYNLIRKSAAYQQDLQKNKSTPAAASQEQKRVDEKDMKPKTGSIGVRSEAVGIAAQISNSKMTKEQRNALWAQTQSSARR